MRPQGPTFWHLDGQTSWCTDTDATAGVAVDAHHLRLEADANGPLSLLEPTGSLGRLTLPRGFALDEAGTVYLLAPGKPWWVKRFHAEKKAFVRLPAVGGTGSEARQFRNPGNIATAGSNLYVADTGNRRVQVFDGRSLVLRHVWQMADWLPVDVTAQGGFAYVLDGQNGRVYRHQPGIDRLRCVVADPAAAGRWTRLIVDRNGRIYLLDPTKPTLEIYDAAGNFLEKVNDAGDVRDRFDPPPLVLVDDGGNGRFCLPADLQKLCGRQAPWPPASPQSPLAHCPPWFADGVAYSRQGEPLPPLDPAALVLPQLYQKSGVWISQAINSTIYECQWHRLDIEVDNLPPGSKIIVSTITSQNKESLNPAGTALANSPEEELWQHGFTITGPMQASAEPAAAPEWHTGLVQSRQGQYIWLRLELKSDGFASPTISGIRVHYPRASYLAELPAVFSADDTSRWFLERYLSLAQKGWDDLEAEIEQISRYFDPHTVPEGEFLEYLAGWLALPLEGSWDWSQKRRLLEAAPAIYPQRGKLTGLRQYIRVYLQNMARQELGSVTDFYPQIVEGFRLRHYLMLNQDSLADLDVGTPLWSPQVVGRLQLGVFAREGEVRLVSTGDPERDLFHEFAHRFQLFVPAAWVKTAADERMLRRAIDSEKPAHAAYKLHLVESRLQIGRQSTVGVDTIIGKYPVAQLTCSHDGDWPPSRERPHRLGLDTVLAGSPKASGVKLTPGSRVGIETFLT